MCKLRLLLMIISLLPKLALAEKTQSLPEVKDASTKEEDKPSDCKVSGYIDGSYNYLVRSNRFTSGTFNRVYDLKQNGFTLHQVGVTLANQPKEGVGGLLNVILGRDANITAAYGYKPNFISRDLAIDSLQAYLQYASGSLISSPLH